ncbi:hypothetical protein [Alicyclobacillus fructus]|uniref:hypothetical protein n=1 Tax=Alicyclobacillus fructus TaxID=2816082 RepID=UPI001F4018C4|nr:hypothetical protein [Alicyclobacillus fructus]
MAPVFVLLAPILGALLSNLVPATAAPLAATWWGPVRWRDLLLTSAGARRSFALGIIYSLVYLLLLVAARTHRGLDLYLAVLGSAHFIRPSRCWPTTCPGPARGPIWQLASC